MSKKTLEVVTHVAEFIFFFFVAACVWAEGDLLRFLTVGRKPAASQCLWLIGAYAVLWTATGLYRQFTVRDKRSRTIKPGNESVPHTAAAEPNSGD